MIVGRNRLSIASFKSAHATPHESNSAKNAAASALAVFPATGLGGGDGFGGHDVSSRIGRATVTFVRLTGGLGVSGRRTPQLVKNALDMIADRYVLRRCDIGKLFR